LKVSTSRVLLASAVVYAAATAIIGRYVLASPAAAIAADVGDPVLNAAILAWNARTMPWTDAWFDFPAFHPATSALTFSEHLLGVSVIAAPLEWLAGDAIVAYNVTLLLGYVLSGLAMFALAQRLTGNASAAFVAGAAFAFVPYRAAQVSHIQVGIVFWAPLALLGLHGYIETGRRRWLALFGLCWMLQGAANGYFLVFFSVLVGLWILWFVVARGRWRDLLMIAATLALAALPLAPILVRFSAAHAHYGLSRPPEEIAGFGADIAGVLCASSALELWGSLQVACRPEGELFPGLTVLVLCVAGGLVAMRRPASPAGIRSPRAAAGFYLCAALATWALAWGPAPALQGERVLPYGPYSLLLLVPGMDGLRVPARFWMMTALCLSVLAGYATALLMARHSRVMRLLVPVVALAIIAEGASAIPAARLLPPPPDPDALRRGIVLTLPLGSNRDIDINAQFRAVIGGWTSVNGFSGYEPFHYAQLRRASSDEDPHLFATFLRHADLHVVTAPNASRLVDLVERQPGAMRVAMAGDWRQYRLPRHAKHAAPLSPGAPLTVGRLSASCSEQMLPLVTDGDYTTRWECGPQVPGQTLTIDFGRAVNVAAVVPAVGQFRSDQPRVLIVEVSRDGVEWQAAWNGPVRTEMLEAEMEDPLKNRLVVPLGSRTARYVRLRQVGQDDAFYWSIAELEVWGDDSAQ
jgi:hypothetical protein